MSVPCLLRPCASSGNARVSVNLTDLLNPSRFHTRLRSRIPVFDTLNTCYALVCVYALRSYVCVTCEKLFNFQNPPFGFSTRRTLIQVPCQTRCRPAVASIRRGAAKVRSMGRSFVLEPARAVLWAVCRLVLVLVTWSPGRALETSAEPEARCKARAKILESLRVTL